MARIYLASSWRNPYQADAVKSLRLYGHEVYDFKNPPNGIKGFAWSDIGLDPSVCTASEYIHAVTTHPRAAQGYISDLRAMEWADTGVLLLPSGRSAHLEAGWMKGRGKHVIIVTQDGEEPELMALLCDHIVTNIEEVGRILDR